MNLANVNPNTIAVWGIVATVVSAFLSAFISYFLSQRKVKRKEEEILELSQKNETIGKELKKAQNAFPKDLEIIEDVTDVLKDKLLPLIKDKAAKKETIIIDNFGLDLETVMPWLNHKIIASEQLTAVSFEMRSLIINPNSEYIKTIIDGKSNISSSIVNASVETAKNLVHQDLLKFSFELRQYDLPPIFHGFMLNNEYLFIGFTEIDKGKLMGGIKPYLYLSKKRGDTSDITTHYFKFFKDWFEYYWNISTEVANVKK